MKTRSASRERPQKADLWFDAVPAGDVTRAAVARDEAISSHGARPPAMRSDSGQAVAFVLSAPLGAYSLYCGIFAIRPQALTRVVYVGLDRALLVRTLELFGKVALAYAL